MSFIEHIEDDLDALLREVGLRLDLTQNSTLTTHDFIDRTRVQDSRQRPYSA